MIVVMKPRAPLTQRAGAPGTPASCAPRRAAPVKPWDRAAAAGKAELRSGVTVKKAARVDSGVRAGLARPRAVRSSLVAADTASGSLAGQVVAPRVLTSGM